ASDALAMLQVTNEYVELMDKEIVIVTKESVTIKKLNGEVVERAPYVAELDASDIEKGTYPYYMLKEIDEQPLVIRRLIEKYRNEQGELAIDEDIVQAINEADRLYIVACGTSY
ncbi:MAG: glutamine--fructose-6-phosphate aminotransferase, partial [Anoxybacillus mongoliensis]|nr:glutamine--fructose-6-phosphate aminotransferase [Anoxybacillus mongoliensis]